MFGVTAVGTATAGYFLSLGSVGLFVLSAIMLRAAVTDYKLPVLIILIASLLALVALLLSLGALVFGQISQLNVPRSLIAVVLSAAVFVPVFLAGRALEGMPMINDIMTDINNPPQFEVVPTQRKAFDNSLELSEKRLALHEKHYGDLAPLILEGTPDGHFDKVLALIKARGWKIVAENRSEGIVEATDTTVLFGFKDDVVIRLTAENRATRIDMRSASRQGQSDYRVNANRIEAFMADLKTASDN